jgi:hypothetical protein
VKRNVAAVLLLAHALLLGFWAAARTAPFEPPPLGALWSGTLLRAAASLAGRALATTALFVPVGFLAVEATRRPAAQGRLQRGPLAVLLALAVVAAVLILWPGRGWRVTDLLPLLLASCGAVLGVGANLFATREPRVRRRTVRALAAAAVLLGLALAAAVLLSIERAPLADEGEAITSAEKRRVYRVIRAANPRWVPRGRTKTLRLTARDLEVLSAWGRDIVGSEWRAGVALGAGTVRVVGSLPLDGDGRFVNAALQVRPVRTGGTLAFRIDELRLGRVALPRPALAVLSPVATALVRRDERVRPLLDATQRLEVSPAALTVTYGRVDLPASSVADVLGQGLTEEVDPEAVRAHVKRLVEASRGIKPGETAVPEAVQSVFAFARDRTGASTAVLENRAGLVALGIVLGHARLQSFVGRAMEPADGRALAPALRRPPMRGRKDWTRHFFVSAALAALSAESLSDAAGLFKEELDADGGSGFSFADLLADRAGTCFALAATRDEASARDAQARVADGIAMDELFPAPSDLPEGIADGDLARDYGGVGGEAYRLVADEIERRLPWCSEGR